jgi:transcriptional regulator with XRE-family HTH domain
VLDRPPAQIAFGRAVREVRVSRGVSQEALAFEIGVHRTYLGSIERGERNVSLLNIVRVARALNLSGADLLQKAEL